MEGTLHQLVDGLSQYSPIIYIQCFIAINNYQLLQEFVHPHINGLSSVLATSYNVEVGLIKPPS
jgi:hypothetical protein